MHPRPLYFPSEHFSLGCNLPSTCLSPPVNHKIIKDRTDSGQNSIPDTQDRPGTQEVQVKSEPQLNSGSNGDPKSPGKIMPQKTPLSNTQKPFFSPLFTGTSVPCLPGLSAVIAVMTITVIIFLAVRLERGLVTLHLSHREPPNPGRSRGDPSKRQIRSRPSWEPNLPSILHLTKSPSP